MQASITAFRLFSLIPNTKQGHDDLLDWRDYTMGWIDRRESFRLLVQTSDFRYKRDFWYKASC